MMDREERRRRRRAAGLALITKCTQIIRDSQEVIDDIEYYNRMNPENEPLDIGIDLVRIAAAKKMIQCVRLGVRIPHSLFEQLIAKETP